MRFLVTGGAGFIGSALVRKLLSYDDYEVINIDALTYSGNLNSLTSELKNKRHYFEKCDICDSEELSNIFKKYQPDIVFNLAAESHVDRSIENPEQFLQTNILGTANVLNASLNLWKENRNKSRAAFRLIHISTDEVYGDLGDSNSLFDENFPYNPSSPYAASKASSDHLVRAWGRTYDLPYVISNCSNNYGPYQFPEKFIPHTIINAIQGNNLPIYGNGLQIRDWLYVDDHVDALIKIAKLSDPMKSYNIGGHNEMKNFEVVQLICSYLEELDIKKSIGVKSFSDLITYVSDRPGHDIRYAIDSSKIQSELGWQPSGLFEDKLINTIDWYLNNESWWQNILNGEYKLNRLGKIE